MAGQHRKPSPARVAAVYRTAAMKMPKDLREGVFVNIHTAGGRTLVEYVDKRIRRGGLLRGLFGSVEIEKRNDCGGHWEVVDAGADSGWGPLLYEVAMEHAYPAGLMSDRGMVSGDALKVWLMYERRKDVEQVPVNLDPWNPDEDCEPEGPLAPQALHSAFRKRPRFLAELKAGGNLMYNGKPV